jgi:cation:H+ antiporter
MTVMIWDILILVVALAGVVKGADWFLGAAEKVGVSLRLPPFILGVLLVGFGTSLPELATSISAVIDGVDTIAIANIAGSNIANVFVIIGLSTIALGTIKFDKNLIDLDVPIMIGITALFSIMIVDGALSRADGILLLLGFVGYIIYSLGYKEDKQHHKGLISLIAALSKGTKTKVERQQNMIGPFTILILLGSVALLGLSSKFAVDALLDIVAQVDVGVGVLSFFALAIGTSLPELLVSVKALRQGKGDLVVGNIIGSSMFNVLLIGGFSSVLRPQAIDPALVGWIIAALGLSVLMLMVGSISKRIHLWEGFIYIMIYLTIASKIAAA